MRAVTDGYTPRDFDSLKPTSRTERNKNKGCVALVTFALLAVMVFIGAYIARMGWDAAAQETIDAR